MKPLVVLLALCALLLGVAEAQEKGKLSDAAAKLNARGVALMKEGKLEEAVAVFQQAAEAAPSSGVIQSNLAYAYDRQGRVDEAVAAYRKVLEVDADNAVVRNNLATLYSKQGRFDAAIREYEDLLQRDPANATVKTNLETATKKKATAQERQEQIDTTVKGAEAQPNDPRAAYKAARVYAHNGDADSAITWLTKALDLGYDQFDYLSVDPALVNLRKDPRFLKLLEERRPAR